LFVLRRFLQLGSSFYVIDHSPIQQIQVVMLLNLLMIIFKLGIKPLEGRLSNRMEIINELTILYSSFVLPIYTDWVDDLQIKEVVGWVSISIVLLGLLTNFSMILFFLIKNLRLLAIRIWVRCGYHYQSVKRKGFMYHFNVLGYQDKHRAPFEDGRTAPGIDLNLINVKVVSKGAKSEISDSMRAQSIKMMKFIEKHNETLTKELMKEDWQERINERGLELNQMRKQYYKDMLRTTLF
jgi:hypothetical protein